MLESLEGSFLNGHVWPSRAAPQTGQSSTDPRTLAFGARIEAFKHKFIITHADEYVLKYVKAHVDDFPTGTLNSEKKAQQTPNFWTPLAQNPGSAPVRCM